MRVIKTQWLAQPPGPARPGQHHRPPHSSHSFCSPPGSSPCQPRGGHSFLRLRKPSARSSPRSSMRSLAPAGSDRKSRQVRPVTWPAECAELVTTPAGQAAVRVAGGGAAPSARAGRAGRAGCCCRCAWLAAGGAAPVHSAAAPAASSLPPPPPTRGRRVGHVACLVGRQQGGLSVDHQLRHGLLAPVEAKGNLVEAWQHAGEGGLRRAARGGGARRGCCCGRWARAARDLAWGPAGITPLLLLDTLPASPGQAVLSPRSPSRCAPRGTARSTAEWG
jgi:hypothetical protein